MGKSELEKLVVKLDALARDLEVRPAGVVEVKAKRRRPPQKVANPQRAAPPPPGTAVNQKREEIANRVHTCPHCGFTGLIGDHFGLRTDQYGRFKFASWCRPCRSSRDSHPSRFGLDRAYASVKKPSPKK